VRVAAVDLGTNTTRLLVADVEDGRIDEVHREARITRLGEGVDARPSRPADGRPGRSGDPPAVARVAGDRQAEVGEMGPQLLATVATWCAYSCVIPWFSSARASGGGKRGRSTPRLAA